MVHCSEEYIRENMPFFLLLFSWHVLFLGFGFLSFCDTVMIAILFKNQINLFWLDKSVVPYQELFSLT